MTAMTQATPYYVPKEPGRWRALALAAAVHAALFAFLWIGVRWQNDVPVAIEAEVWSPQIKEAAPPPPPIVKPEPEVKPEPMVKETPKPIVDRPVAKPDIALEREKKRKEQKAREEEKLREQQRLEQQRAEQQKKLELAKKEAAEKKRKEQAEQEHLEKIRQDTLKRMLAQAGPATGSGDAPQTQGPRGSAEYAARVAAKIKSNTVFVVPDNLAGNPAVEYAVDLLPDGSIRRPIRKLRSSGVPGFDEAVLNAIEKSQPFPPDKSGKVPSGFNIVHRPKDQ
jgi:colicin import membrane protein